MRGNLPGPEGLARGRVLVCCRWALAGHRICAMGRRLHPLPAHYPMAWAKPNCSARIYGLANAAHAKYPDRLPSRVRRVSARGGAARPDY